MKITVLYDHCIEPGGDRITGDLHENTSIVLADLAE